MTRYIVRPKQLNTSNAVSLAATSVGASSRAAQLEAVSEYRLNNAVDQNLRSWIREAGPAVRHVSRGETQTRATGTTVVDMSEEEAMRLRAEVDGLIVIEDQPLELIRPKQVSATTANPTQANLWHLDSVGLKAARDAGFRGTGRGVTVAVLDTGIDPTHPELANRVVDAVTFDVDTWTTIPQTPSSDTHGHGTHVAGLVAGNRVGIAPDAELVNGVMIPGGHGNLSDFILALEWAATMPEVAIINMSAGIRGFASGMEDAVEALLAVGVLPVIATGNEGRNKTRSPGNYNPVLSVGACDRFENVASFSSSGAVMVDNHLYNVPDLVAPGKDVMSCVMGGGYEAWDGTSMATPIVSGVAALIIERHPTVSVLDLMDTLIDTCENLGVAVERQGAGKVRVTAAHSANLALLGGTGAGSSRSAVASVAAKKKAAVAGKRSGRRKK